MTRTLSALLLGLIVAVPTWAAENGHDGMGGMNHAAANTALSSGTVKKVNKARHKLTIRHGPLANLNMPAMTMIFRVKNQSWLDRVKAGDHIRFRAEMVNGQLTVTRLKRIH